MNPEEVLLKCSFDTLLKNVQIRCPGPLAAEGQILVESILWRIMRARGDVGVLCFITSNEQMGTLA